MTFEDLYQKIHRGGLKVVVTGHKNPDGDAIGSALALYHYLFLKHNQVHIIMPNNFPAYLKWLQGAERIIVYDKHQSKANKLLSAADIVFSLDYNAMQRSGKMEGSMRQCQATKVMIDHHPDPVIDDFDLIRSDTGASSTAELCYEFIENTGDVNLINKAMSEAIYAGIMTDTGSFSYNCNHPEPFRITATLVVKGLDIRMVNDAVYNNKREENLRLLGHALSSCLTVIPDYRTAYIALNSEDLQRYDYQNGDTEGLVNYALSIRGIEVAALFTSRDEIIRLSLRSKGSFRVDNFARRHFDGGGHKNAAGGNSQQSMDETITKFLNLLDQYSDELRKD